jgi:hypothetical protein
MSTEKVTAMRFSPSSEYLCVTTVFSDILMFVVIDRALSDWTTQTLGRIPAWLKCRQEIISGIAFSGENRLFINGASYSCLVDLTVAGVEKQIRLKRMADGLKIKKNRGDMKGFTRIERFSPLMMLDFVGEDEMVVVERPFLKIMENLPEGYSHKTYGGA